MTDEQMRIAIAEACGWKPYKPITHDGWPLLMTPPKKPNKEGWLEPIPDYLNDLNACAEFEATLTDAEHLRYRVQLWNVVITEGDETTWDRQFISATARQRAEAFLKTKGILP